MKKIIACVLGLLCLLAVLFGCAGKTTEDIAKEHNLDVLAKLPMNPALAAACDAGNHNRVIALLLKLFNRSLGRWLRDVLNCNQADYFACLADCCYRLAI